jgi:hypothetical protein
MSVLSITAPQFTAEDECLEQESYKEEELEAAERDLFGRTLEETQVSEEELERLLQDFHQALEEIPLEDKEAYVEALERVPQLVELESHPLTFLKAEEDHAWAAAERCVQYWELRRWLFGERAWLPMTSTGNGTLCQDDINLLKTGFCCLLDDDGSERGVVCFQVTSRKLDYDRMAMVRVIFYVLTVALERPSVQENGLVLVADTKVSLTSSQDLATHQRCLYLVLSLSQPASFFLQNYTTSRFDRKFIKIVAYLFTGYHPITTRAYHICAPPGKSCFLLVLPFIRYFMTRHVRQRFLLHTGTAPECAMDLQDYGIPSKHLPQAMGGEYTMAKFGEWLDHRRSLEMEREEQLFGDDLCDGEYGDELGGDESDIFALSADSKPV